MSAAKETSETAATGTLDQEPKATTTATADHAPAVATPDDDASTTTAGAEDENQAGALATRESLTRAAARGTLATLALRLLSFVCTQWTLRLLDPTVLGQASIQLELLLTTVLFVSREGFRLTLTKTTTTTGSHDDDDDWWSVALLSVPTGTLLSFLALVFHLYNTGSSNSGSTHTSDDFRLAGILYCVACWIEIAGEPLTLHALSQLQVTRKVSAESMATVAKTLATIVLLHNLQHQWPVTAFGLAQVLYAAVYTAMLVFSSSKRTITLGQIPTTLNPSLIVTRALVDNAQTCYLVLLFTLQGCFKHFLTEGDRIVLTALSNNYNQGVYAMGSAYGGMAARILFQPIEENCRLLWGRLVGQVQQQQAAQQQAGNDANQPTANDNPPRVLLLQQQLEDSYTTVTKVVLYVGFCFACLAVNYTELLLNVLAGRKWGQNAEAVAVLSAFCIYTAFLAWNGTTEALVYATAQAGRDVGRLSLAHTLVGLVFGAAAPWAVQRRGTVGLVAVNCLAMLLRCLYSIYAAAQYFCAHPKKQEGDDDDTGRRIAGALVRLLRRMFPNPLVLVAFGGSYMATAASLQSLHTAALERGIVIGSGSWFRLALQKHVSVGLACALVVTLVAAVVEPEAQQGLSRRFIHRRPPEKVKED